MGRRQKQNAVRSWVSRGVYTPDHAARLLGLRADMIVRWVYGTNVRDAAVVPEHPKHAGDLITFVDLVQAMAIRDIRNQRRLSLQKIRMTVEAARRRGVMFPFARRHTTYVFSDDVVLRLNDGRLMQVTGKYHDNDLMEPLVEEYLNDIGFDDHGLADRYTPLEHGFRKVVLTPHLNYGAPTVVPCGYSVATLVDAFCGEGDIDAAASVCNVNPNDVTIALEYEERLKPAA